MSRYTKKNPKSETRCITSASTMTDVSMATGGTSFDGNRQVCVGEVPDAYYPSVKQNFWQRLSLLEKILMMWVLLLILAIIVLSAILDNWTRTASLNVFHFTSEYKSLDNNTSVPYCTTPACVTAASDIINAMDQTVDPCDNFYLYACGGWIKSNPLPEGRSFWGTLSKLWQKNMLVIRSILEDDTVELKSEAEKKARVFYYSCLDKNETIEELGSQPILSLTEKIGGWSISGDVDMNQWNFQDSLQLIHNTYGRGGLFKWWVENDDKNSSRNILQIDEGELSLPNRDYYLDKVQHEEIWTAYLTYMTNVGVLLGGEENDTRQQMKEVLEFERKLANITTPNDQKKDINKRYHKMAITELQTLAPVINWIRYFNHGFQKVGRIIEETQEIVVYAPEFLQKLSYLITQYLSSPEGRIILNNYLGWSLVEDLTGYLSKPFTEASDSLEKALFGSVQKDLTWRFCVWHTSTVIGFPVGAMFVRETFSEDSKIAAKNMINDVRKAFKDGLSRLDWLDAKTLTLIEDKADAITASIGYPDFIFDYKKLDETYEGLEFKEDRYFENNIRAQMFFLVKNMERLDKPVDKLEWQLTPTVVNAYYSYSLNNIGFPAGFLQAPFFNTKLPKYLNFGAAGVTMGHEIIHAFDNQGRKYDKNGNLRQWWNNKIIENFEERAQCLVHLYSSYSVYGNYLNGNRTLEENIADNGGLEAAFRAYEEWSCNHKMEPLLPGLNLSHKQLFFLKYGQTWCSTSTPEELHFTVMNEVHSPPVYRSTEPLISLPCYSRD
ncbi:endothelin-converting enzyme homolog isoform X2 [Tachypleus tridentatus]|uniref:endothelin-converting enzyme homolog isoform X2 n=1 Tax=Tachypleus tridentatus TaxID=6853 RepID=UPI003FD0C0EB